MARKKSPTWLLIVTLVAGVIVWWLDNRGPGETAQRSGTAQGGETVQGGYRRMEGCRWVENRGNDGDSFRLQVPGGGVEEFRLYFVDAPESAVKHYGGGESNEERLRDQGDYFDGLSEEETTAVGQAAKKFTAGVLGKVPFTVLTRDEEVYGGPRVYCFVQVEEEGAQRWLHELLVEQGLARIHTKGAELPDGTSPGREESRLKGLEREARKGKRGGWR